jgi:hypothetical protein
MYTRHTPAQLLNQSRHLRLHRASHKSPEGSPPRTRRKHCRPAREIRKTITWTPMTAGSNLGQLRLARGLTIIVTYSIHALREHALDTGCLRNQYTDSHSGQ